MKLMVEDLTDLQKEKIGKYNSIEEFSFKINQPNEEKEAEDRSIQDPGKYEGTSPKQSVCNGFKELCLSGIEDKRHFEFIEWNNSDCDENPCSLISDRNLADTMVLEKNSNRQWNY